MWILQVPRALVTRKLPSSVIAKLEAACEVDLYTGARAISREELLQRVKGVNALVCLLTDAVDTVLLDAAGPQLKVVANVAVGYNNIDVPACRARGIVVTNTPDVLTNACADFTWGLILAITRRLGEGERQLRAGAWGGSAVGGKCATVGRVRARLRDAHRAARGARRSSEPDGAGRRGCRTARNGRAGHSPGWRRPKRLTG